MVIDVVFAATSAQVRVESRIAGYQEVYSNSLLFDAAKKTLYAIGRTEEDIERESPEVWARRPASLQFKPIYDAARFDLWLTSAVLYYFQSAIHRRVRSALALAWWGRFDRFRYDLWLPDYASIQPALRQQFEQEVYLSNRREVCELVINGAARQRP